MTLEAAYIKKIMDGTGFDASNLEKAIRLRQLLAEFHKHPFLTGRVVLKGGTAINFFYLNLVRLSVDIDLNYIGQLDRAEMIRERPEVAKAVEDVSGGLGYKIQRGVQDHALMEWYLGYQNHIGAFDQIQVEVNFLMRACALPPQVRKAVAIGEETSCEFSVLAVEELFGGKLKAMIDRRNPRDLYDLFRFAKTSPDHDPDLMRRLAVLFSSTMARDFRTFGMERLEEVDADAIKRLLYPLLKSNDRPTGPEMFSVAKPILEGVLDHRHEHKFLEAMAGGEYQPELLFPERADIVDRIRRHPALMWKAENVARYVARKKA